MIYVYDIKYDIIFEIVKDFGGSLDQITFMKKNIPNEDFFLQYIVIKY